MKFAEIAVDAPLGHSRLFSYEIPSGLIVLPGNCVMVPFGSQVLQGIVFKISDTSLVEKTVGRNKSFLNAPRLIDIDILMWGDQEFITPILTSPHPRMTEREFVLRPLIDLLPKVVHPITKKTVFEMYKDAKGSNGLMRHV